MNLPPPHTLGRWSRLAWLPVLLRATVDTLRKGAMANAIRNQPCLLLLTRYSFAVLAVALGMGAWLMLVAWFGPGLPAYITFYPMVMIVALLAGFGPGLLATVLAAISAAFWILPTYAHHGASSSIERVGIVIFFCSGLLMCLICELYRRVRNKASAYDREEALRESRTRLAAFGEATFEGIVESEAGRIVDCNEQFARIMDSTVADLIGTEISSMIAPEDLDLVLANIREGADSVTEHLVIRKDGSRIHVEAHGRPVSPGSARRLTAIRDITARMQARAELIASRAAALNLMEDAIAARDQAERSAAELREREEALRRSEQFARSQWAETEAALEAIPANIAILDSDGVIVRVNTAWKSFCSQNEGRPETANVGVNYLAVCESATGPEADDAQRFAAGIHRVIHGECERFSMEYPCHSPTEQRWFIGYVTAALSEGTAARAVIAHVDISEQKRIEDQIRNLNIELESRVIARTAKLRAAVAALQSEIDKRKRLEREILEISEREQSRFGQDLHDGLGQELAGIAMISNVLAGKLQAEAHPLAQAAGNITTYISDSIESTRQLAKGLYPIELDRYGLLLALEDLANQTSLRFGIHCELRQSGEPPKLEHSAEIHIYRIVQESIGNAIKHGKAGHVIIESAAGDGAHTFTITDDGIGIQKPIGKHGMGLNLMKYRARVIGAKISVERPEKGGCRITCRLPV